MSYFCNGWNWVHLLGSYFGATFGAAVFQNTNVWTILIGVLIVDILKEIGDTIAKRLQSELMFKVGFDPAGFDIRDVGMCCVGLLLSMYQLSVIV